VKERGAGGREREREGEMEATFLRCLFGTELVMLTMLLERQMYTYLSYLLITENMGYNQREREREEKVDEKYA